MIIWFVLGNVYQYPFLSPGLGVPFVAGVAHEKIQLIEKIVQ